MQMKLDNKKMLKDSAKSAFGLLGILGTIFSIIGCSISDYTIKSELPNYVKGCIALVILVVVWGLIFFILYHIKKSKYGNNIIFNVGNNKVTIKTGDIFIEDGYRVIGVDNSFVYEKDKIDDVIINKSSLHGQLVLNHSDEDIMKSEIDAYAEKNGIESSDGKYDFELGTIIHHVFGAEHYIMLALTKLNDKLEARSSIYKHEEVLKKMWENIDSQFSAKKIVLPVLGNGVIRFDDGEGDFYTLVECIIRTLYYSKKTFREGITIVAYVKDSEESKAEMKQNMLKLYELTDRYN